MVQDTAQDTKTLQDIRDGLKAYLAGLEKRESEAREWLVAFEYPILAAHHWLNRAINMGREGDALYIFNGLGDAATVVLAIDDLEAKARKAFGPKSALAAEMAKHAKGLPDDIASPPAAPDLPAIPAEIKAPPPAPPSSAPEKKWWKPGTWFNKSAPAEDNTAFEEAARLRDKIRGEITALQSDRHYYIDSFMDWVGDELEPAGEKASMESYKDPKRIVELATTDHLRNMTQMTEAIGRRAKFYYEIATMVDEQKMDEFTAVLPLLFENRPGVESMRKLLLKDYNVASFAELAFERIRDRDAQLLLFKTALQFEKQIVFTGARTRDQILARISQETSTRQRRPLDREALRLARKRLDELEYEEREEHERQRRNRRPQEDVSLSDLFNRALEGIGRALKDALEEQQRPARRPRR